MMHDQLAYLTEQLSHFSIEGPPNRPMHYVNVGLILWRIICELAP